MSKTKARSRKARSKASPGTVREFVIPFGFDPGDKERADKIRSEIFAICQRYESILICNYDQPGDELCDDEGNFLIMAMVFANCGDAESAENSVRRSCGSSVVSHNPNSPHETDVTIGYLFELLAEQNYECSLIGGPIDLHLAYNPQQRAFLDRIDSSRGYTPGNVQWIGLLSAMVKRSMSQEQFDGFCLG
jgi:hypothetical protein